jgi:amino acid adenylation domain-containing protein
MANLVGLAQEPDLLVRFDDAVQARPHALAIRSVAGDITFTQLNERVNRMAAALIDQGVSPRSRVGVCLPRDPDLLVTLLAVWRAGCAYVPMDPVYPPDRLAFMADDSDITLAVTATEDGAAWAGTHRVLALDALAAVSCSPSAPALPRYMPGQLAYIIYTSGSSGRPKGVAVSRGNVARLVRSLENSGLYAATPRTVAWNASVCFDASVQQWARVCRGDAIVLIDEDLRSAPAELATYLADMGVTDLDLTPSHWDVLREHLKPAAREATPLRLFVGGEAIPSTMWRNLADLRSQGVVDAFNLYGPTECTVDATTTPIDGEHPHIGVPLAGVRAYVLDDQLRSVADDSIGELYLAGATVADGYFGRPGLTAKCFVADPFAADGSRMYRTCDRVRRGPDGVLEYHGRTDRQVKLHGYRIELSEIETRLGEHPDISATFVTLFSHPHLGQVLVAYYTPAGGQQVAADSLRRHLLRYLPEFMAPTAYVPLPRLPRTGSGKIDIAALPSPVFGTPESTGEDDSGISDAIEELIAQTWAAVLGQDQISATDNFFALGGHSLVALQVVAQLKKRMGVVIPTRMVYQHPELRDLAAQVSALRTAGRG